MRKIMKKSGALIIITMLSIGFSCLAYAQKDESHLSKIKSNGKELRQEIQGYLKTNALPDLKSWKAKLDAALSKEDLATLNDLRSKAKELNTEKKNDISELRLDKKSDNQQGVDDIKAKMKDLKSGMKTLFDELKPIAEKYSNTIEGIASTAKPKIETWKESIKSIIENWKKDNKNGSGNANGKNGMFHNKFMGGGNPKRMVAMFMLWDGTEDFLNQQSFRGFGTNKSAQTLSSGNLTLSVSPNPITDAGNIKFDLPKNESVQIEIYDNFANKIGDIFTGNMSQGNQSVDFNLSNGTYKTLSNGVYIIKVRAGEYCASQKVIVKR